LLVIVAVAVDDLEFLATLDFLGGNAILYSILRKRIKEIKVFRERGLDA